MKRVKIVVSKQKLESGKSKVKNLDLSETADPEEVRELHKQVDNFLRTLGYKKSKGNGRADKKRIKSLKSIFESLILRDTE